MRIKWLWVVLFAAITAAITMLVRIPIPGTGGYLNVGDMAVIFCGLFLRGWLGAIAGGVGSAIADILGGFFIFAPVTFIAKGLEGLIAGTLGTKSKYWLIPAVLAMVVLYFIAEILIPGMGFAAALSELPFNIIQAIVGGFGGYLIYNAVRMALPPPKK